MFTFGSESTLLPTGPLTVGCFDLMIGHGKDSLLMRVFYPTDLPKLTTNKGEWAPWYLRDQYVHGLLFHNKHKFIPQSVLKRYIVWNTYGVKVPGIWGAPVVGEGRVPLLPLMVFSPGLGTHRGLYSGVCAEMASHGILVAALEHRDGSSCATFTVDDAGEEAWSYLTLGEGLALRESQLVGRVSEVNRALAELEKIHLGESDNLLTTDSLLPSTFKLSSLKGRLNLEQTILAGHSFGGGTVVAGLSSNPKYKMGICLDPWMFPLAAQLSTVVPSVTQPVLCIAAERFQTPRNLEGLQGLPPGTARFITLKNCVHEAVSDGPLLSGSLSWFFFSLSNPTARLYASLHNCLMLDFIRTTFGLPVPPPKTSSELLEKHKDKILPGLHGTAPTMVGWDFSLTG